VRIYRCKTFYASGLANEPEPVYPWDYSEPEEMSQRGAGVEALEHAFHQCHVDGRDMNVGDVVGLSDGGLWRCEMSGWTELPKKLWAARVQKNQQHRIH
jgi:hypothetical protein